ncbi:hypothetical protein [Paludisphaera sp.]|uniref:hypothetical protein n=1 Tax=Paludisphaera sp. TaxID=2017432 RepID=UPI00301CC77C
MSPKTIEGTWEDVASRATEFAGRRVRVILLDDAPAPDRGTAPRPDAIPDHLLDHDAVAQCEREADDTVTLEEVRAATASIRGSMSRLVIDEERAERF